jgi:hypothetical protein
VQLALKQIPRPDELWLGRPPDPMIARILEVESGDEDGRATVSYVLYDEQGSSLEHVSGAPLDESWWSAYQPLTERQG